MGMLNPETSARFPRLGPIPGDEDAHPLGLLEASALPVAHVQGQFRSAVPSRADLTEPDAHQWRTGSRDSVGCAQR
jgi:hypothetical protein